MAVGVAGTDGVGVNPVGMPVGQTGGGLGVGSGESGGGSGESKRATEGDNVRANTMATSTTSNVIRVCIIPPAGSIVARTFDRRKQVLPC